ncbi:MAG: DUF11 domain-containing protein [Acidobacteria bacterium]|nr:DUF11 domain-containing protein [Acidobacteriota bacterium]
MTFTCPLPRRAARSRLPQAALILLGGLALILNAAPAARAQTPTPTPVADITVTKSGSETARIGGTIIYNISVTNGGPDTATNVVLTDPIPAHTTYVSAESPFPDPNNPEPPPGVVSFSNNTLTVTFDSIPAFESRNARLIVRVNTDTPPGYTVSNTVTGTANGTDPNTDDNSSTALTSITGPFPGAILISEFRLRGPAGAADEFIELYNNSDTPHTVQPVDDSAGYAVAASDGVIRCVVESGTIIPARGHFLCANNSGEGGYSLATYPAGDDVPTATPDATYTQDIPDNAGIALFRTASTKEFTLNNRLDAVGSTSEENTLYREGTGYPALSGAAYTAGLEYSFVRDLCGKSGSITTFGPCPTGGAAKDSDNNAADFFFVDTSGANAGAGQRLGAPGPENLGSPYMRNGQFSVTLLDPCAGTVNSPNRARDFTSDPKNNSPFGTLDIRRTVTNGTGQDVTRLRWRIVDITTFPAPSGIADLRARSSEDIPVAVDRAPCNTEASTVTVYGTTLEQPPTQSNGGGFNSSLSSGTVTLATPLHDGESIDVHFLLGVKQTGNFKFFINVEALSRDPEVVTEGRPSKPLTGAPAGPSVSPGKKLTALPSSPSTPSDAPGKSSGAPASGTGGGVSAPAARPSKGLSAPVTKPGRGVSKVRRDVDGREF